MNRSALTYLWFKYLGHFSVVSESCSQDHSSRLVDLIMAFFRTLLVAALCSLTWGKSSFQLAKDENLKMGIVQKLNGPPPGWIKAEGKTVDKNVATMTLRIHLTQQDMDKFHGMAMNVSLLNQFNLRCWESIADTLL